MDKIKADQLKGDGNKVAKSTKYSRSEMTLQELIKATPKEFASLRVEGWDGLVPVGRERPF